ncbi:MAG: inverse autotransporter beta domain-containing protein [Hyphomicrobiales bacterium]|nr:inverse autotransporter beta domain-containing protein [Hyphomicrobiales bacterium]
MNLFRPAVFALSMALMIPLGASATATTNYFHPPFSVTDGRTLDLRETGSRMVVETVENAVKEGGEELLGEGFQLGSSLNWVFGETMEGEIDAVVPLWSRDGQVVFTQPGMVFWTGPEEEERADGNLGLVYRAPVGFRAIGGASIFYDHDFQVGHSRISLGADIQRGYLQGSANYYQPISDEEKGRTNYIEGALRGMDARLVYERSKLRVSGNLGYWQYGEIEGSQGDWELSYGLEAGVRIREGVFVEAGYHAHDDASIGGRFDLGVALKFSLPGLEGASYGDGSRSANLYKIVEREKRILYEEAYAGPAAVSFRVVPEGQTFVADDVLDAVLTLSRPLKQDVTLNLVSEGTAVYGVPHDWDWSYRVPAGEGNPLSCTSPCPVTFPAGQTTADIRILALFGSDGRTIIAEVEIPPESENLVELGEQTRLEFTIQSRPSAMLSLNYEGPATVMDDADPLRMTIELNNPLDNDVGVLLFSDNTTTAKYGAGESGDDDYYVRYIFVPSDGMPAETFNRLASMACETITSTDHCHIIIPAGQTIVDVEVSILPNGRLNSIAESTNETFNLTVQRASAVSPLDAGTPNVNITINN